MMIVLGLFVAQSVLDFYLSLGVGFVDVTAAPSCAISVTVCNLDDQNTSWLNVGTDCRWWLGLLHLRLHLFRVLG